MLTLAPLFWGGNITVARAMADVIPPIGLSFWRWATAALIVLPFVVPRLRAQWPIVLREARFITALGVLGVGLFPILMYKGLQTTTAINAGFIQAICPVLIPIIAWLMHGTLISARHIVGIVVSSLGAFTIISAGDPLALISEGGTIGDLWVFGATTLWAIYSVVVSRRPSDLESGVVLFTTMMVGVLMLFPLWLGEVATVKGMPFDTQSLLAIGYIAIFPSIGAYLFFNRGVEIVGPSRGGLSMHLVPLFTAMLAILLLGESFYLYHGVGLALIFSGVLIVAGARRA